jgi:dolichol kinase
MNIFTIATTKQSKIVLNYVVERAHVGGSSLQPINTTDFQFGHSFIYFLLMVFFFLFFLIDYDPYFKEQMFFSSCI